MITQKSSPIHPKRMDVWYARIERIAGSYVQGGNRPVLIVSNDINNAVSPIVTVIPITSKAKKPNQPTHVWLDSVSVVIGDTDCDNADCDTTCGDGENHFGVEKQNCGEGMTTPPTTPPTALPTAEARGMILAEQITTIDKDRLLYFIGRLEEAELISQVERAIDVQLGLIEPWRELRRIVGASALCEGQ